MTKHWLDRPRNGLVVTFVVIAVKAVWFLSSQLIELNREAERRAVEIQRMHAEIAELQRATNRRRPDE